jgi:hypothetical protein
MKKIFILIVLALIIVTFYWWTMGTETMPEAKIATIKKYLNTVIIDTLEKDYQSHNITIAVLVSDLAVDKITKKETVEFISYTAYGKVTYIIIGKRTWLDKEGNLIRLDPQQNITHWFSCEIREDKYGELYTDKFRIPLTLYADNPLK